jgi:hypothetical protein
LLFLQADETNGAVLFFCFTTRKITALQMIELPEPFFLFYPSAVLNRAFEDGHCSATKMPATTGIFVISNKV